MSSELKTISEETIKKIENELDAELIENIIKLAVELIPYIEKRTDNNIKFAMLLMIALYTAGRTQGIKEGQASLCSSPGNTKTTKEVQKYR